MFTTRIRRIIFAIVAGVIAANLIWNITIMASDHRNPPDIWNPKLYRHPPKEALGVDAVLRRYSTDPDERDEQTRIDQEATTVQSEKRGRRIASAHLGLSLLAEVLKAALLLVCLVLPFWVSRPLRQKEPISPPDSANR
jgi:hypothetical protein